MEVSLYTSLQATLITFLRGTKTRTGTHLMVMEGIAIINDIAYSQLHHATTKTRKRILIFFFVKSSRNVQF